MDFCRVKIIATAIVFRSFLFEQEKICGWRLFSQGDNHLFHKRFPLIPRVIIVNSAQDFAYLSWHPAYSSRNFPFIPCMIPLHRNGICPYLYRVHAYSSLLLHTAYFFMWFPLLPHWIPLIPYGILAYIPPSPPPPRPLPNPAYCRQDTAYFLMGFLPASSTRDPTYLWWIPACSPPNPAYYAGVPAYFSRNPAYSLRDSCLFLTGFLLIYQRILLIPGSPTYCIPLIPHGISAYSFLAFCLLLSASFLMPYWFP